MSEIFALSTIADAQLAAARASTAGRAALTIHGGRGRALRQTVLALAAGSTTGQHESPGEATLQVLQGRVQLTAGADQWDAGAGDHLTIPAQRHELAASEDAVVLLTVVTSRPVDDR